MVAQAARMMLDDRDGLIVACVIRTFTRLNARGLIWIDADLEFPYWTEKGEREAGAAIESARITKEELARYIPAFIASLGAESVRDAFGRLIIRKAEGVEGCPTPTST